MTSNIKPITQPEITETKINYSIKIGKQVLKQKLKEEIKRLIKSTEDEEKALIISTEERASLYAEMRNRIELFIENDSTFNDMKRLYNSINTNDQISRVKELIVTDPHDLQLLNSCISPTKYTNYKFYKERTERKTVVVSVELKIATYDEEYDEYNPVVMTFKLDITSTLLSVMTKNEKILSVINRNIKDVHELEKKLKNLDEIMEEMEAKLLVQELQKTTDGNEVLGITEQIINNTLNSQITLTN